MSVRLYTESPSLVLSWCKLPLLRAFEPLTLLSLQIIRIDYDSFLLSSILLTVMGHLIIQIVFWLHITTYQTFIYIRSNAKLHEISNSKEDIVISPTLSH